MQRLGILPETKMSARPPHSVSNYTGSMVFGQTGLLLCFMDIMACCILVKARIEQGTLTEWLIIVVALQAEEYLMFFFFNE